MKIARFEHNKKQYWGIIKDDRIAVLADPPFGRLKFSSKEILLKDVRFLAPTVPSKIVLVGLNYRDHASELNMSVPKEPVIFLKPCTSLIGNRDKIVYPKAVKRLDYEAELAFVVKKKARNIEPSRAQEHILGYTCLNDVTARDLQKKDVQWTRSKSFDTFCPVGPWLETDINPSKLKIFSFLNNRMMQKSSTSNFIFPVKELISFVSKVMTLLPGDIISTGTPPGVGPMHPGDRIAVEIEGIGRLENVVI